MNEPDHFQQNESTKIIQHFGLPYYEKVLRDIETYAEQWALTSFQFIPFYSANLVLKCYSEEHGHCVLKIGNPALDELAKEYYTLREYNGRRFCQVFEADLENGVLLEECAQPGTPLRQESSLETRLTVFSSLFEGLHVTPVEPMRYPLYTEWVGRITAYMSKRDDCKELYVHMKQANELCLSISSLYSQRKLLHGDFHHDNILLGKNGEYRIIDPKGVLGDPVFDVPRFILNEFEDEITTGLYEKVKQIIGTFEQKLTIPNEVLQQCLYVETAMGACWTVESGSTPEQYPQLLARVAFAENVMHERI